MRIVVISDSHRNTLVIDRILRCEPDAKQVFFLGDNASDIEDFPYLYPDKFFHAVCGNCDYASQFKTVDMDIVGNTKIIFCHGHTFGVKYSKQRLMETAIKNGCKIALYGHTHIPEIYYENGLYVVNPGSCSEPRNGEPTYAVIDITDAGILPAIKKI